MTTEITDLLERWGAGDREAWERLVPLVYAELHRVARGRLMGERMEHTLQTTALVNEAYMRLAGQDQVQWASRTHFLAVASSIMRRILVDHARKRFAAKRGGPNLVLEVDADVASEPRSADLVDLDDALERLTELDARQAQMVELRYFGGLTIEEVAEVLDCSPATVKREWRSARAWLKRELEPETR